VTPARLEIPLDPAWGTVAHAFVEQVALRHGLLPPMASELATAARQVVEVLLAQEFNGPDGSLRLECRVIAGGIELLVRDQGLPFDPQMWTRPEVAQRLQSVREAVDKLEFANLGLEGKETRLLKFYSAVLEAASSGPVRVPATLAPFHEIRLFRPEDARAVARCVWRTYGYSYSVLDAVYIPERLTALNASGHMRSLVAVNSEGEVIGHLAYERTSGTCKVATAGVAAVEPAYRSQRVASQLAQRLLAQAREDGIAELQCYAVTSHPFSQRLVESCGFKCCSLVLGASLFSFAGMDVAAQQRESLIGYYLALDPAAARRCRRLYVPNRHRAMVESLCQHIGLHVEFQVPERAELVDGETVLQLEESPPRKTAKINLERYGAKALDRIRAQARYLRMQEYRCFHLTLPLEDPNTYFVLKPLEKMGFFFAGLQFRANGLCLLLQDLYGVTIDYSRLKIEDEMAQELLGYVHYMEPEPV
jgi:N-acetylglutamate synthase-like GNAT family acetyltransferase